MTTVVTGGAGFIGSHIVDQLVPAGDDLRVVDALLPSAHRDAPTIRQDHIDRRRVDVTDESALTVALRDADAVCHQAAMVGLGVDFADVTDYCHHNDMGTATLLRVLHRVGFTGRLVLASSMVVYGEGRYRCATHGRVRLGARPLDQLAAGHWEPRCPTCAAELEAEAVTETAPLDPRNVYAATKVHQEHLCQSFVREHPEVSLTILRYHNVYGPGMPRDTPYSGVAAIFRSAVARGEAPLVMEDGGQRRDFVHVADVARANVLALTAEHPVPGTFNIASGTPRTVLDLANALVAAAGPRATPPRVVGGHRPGDVRHVFASTDRARTELGFEARVTFTEGVADFASAPMR